MGLLNIRLIEVLGAVVASWVFGVQVWVRKDYQRINQQTGIAIDEYVGEEHPSFSDRLQCVLLHWQTKWAKTVRKDPWPLVAEDDKHISGLKRTRAAKKSEQPTCSNKPKAPLVIGTIRMGFGHHRLAYAVASYATDDNSLMKERDIYFHDVATIGDGDSVSGMVDDAEVLYSMGSRVLTELPNPIERMLSAGTAGGGPNALRMQVQSAALMLASMEGLDKDSPIIATHPLVGAIAIQAGFTNVVNLVVDNHPQWFVVVPGAKNLIQGPRLYRELIKLGVPDAEIELVGHWNPRNIVETIPEATKRRIQRVEKQQPLRLLIPVGGAGAQQSFLRELIKECAPLVKEGKLQLFLNAGDHDHIKKGFTEQLEESKLDYEKVFDLDARSKFEDNLKRGQEPEKAVTLFAYNNSYAAVSTTDELIPYSDVLVCKPSEMAFFAIPKLMIRRVGDHEAKSAIRASELGDGTLEAGTIPEVMREIHQFFNKPGDLITMNKMIQKNNEVNMYDGARIAIERALSRANQDSTTATH